MLKNHYQILPLASSNIAHSLLIQKKWKKWQLYSCKTKYTEDHRINWSSEETSLQDNSNAWKIVTRRYKHQINVRETAMWICDPQWTGTIRVNQTCYYRKQGFKQFQNFPVCPCFTSHLAALKYDTSSFLGPGPQKLPSAISKGTLEK